LIPFASLAHPSNCRGQSVVENSVEGVRKLSRGIQRTGTVEIDIDACRGEVTKLTGDHSGGIPKPWGVPGVPHFILVIFHETMQLQWVPR
jgi:hypothetical protein